MYTTILFDLDGTLTDPKPGITRSVQYALAKLGIDVPDCNQLTPFIGPPLKSAFMEFYHLTGEQADLAISYYRERFAVTGLYENSVYPGISSLLEQLTRRGCTLAVATSKPTVFSLKILEHFKLSPFFTQIIGSNLDGSRVEKGEVIEFALTQLGEVDPKGLIMVGDRKHDVLGARANGLECIAVGYGYGSQAELSLAEPKQIVQTVAELTKVLLS